MAEFTPTASGPDVTVILALTGPSGVGKTAVAYEVSRQLALAGLDHATIDTDHLDMLYPRPAPSVLTEVSVRNLASVWGTFALLGYRRLVLSLVGADLAEASNWLARSVPGAQVTFVRLAARRETRHARLRQREIGTGLSQHLTSSDRVAARIAQESEGIPTVETDGRSVVEVAREVLGVAGWLPEGPGGS